MARSASTQLRKSAVPRSQRVVLSWLFVAAGVAALHAEASDGVRRVLPLVVCAGTVLAVLRVTRAKQAPLLRFWYPIAAAMASFGGVFGMDLWSGPPSLAIALMALAYVLIGYAVWQIAPGRSRASSGRRAERGTAWVDVPIVVGAAAVLDWQLFVAPYLDGTARQGGLGAAIQPAVALALLGVVVRSLTSGTRRLPSYSLLLLAAVFSLLADAVLSFQALRGRGELGGTDSVLPLLSQLMVLGAAVHPRAALLGRLAMRQRRTVAETLWLAPVGMSIVVLPWLSERLELAPEPRLTSGAAALMVALLVTRCVLFVLGSERLATTDSLTGLASRRAFMARLAEAANLLDGPAVLAIDLDDFKSVNDSGGHAAGDAVLVEVAGRLRSVLRTQDLPARLGGDEFAVLLSAGSESAAAVGRRVAVALNEPFLVGGELRAVSASVGVVPALPAEDPADVLAAADVAMYAAKRAGGGRVEVYSEQTSQQVRARRQLAGDLAHAAAAGPLGGLEVHYQPVLELTSGRLRAAEALLRWRHPQHGLLSAGSFLDLLSTREMTRQVDELVLCEVLRQVADWQRRDTATRDLKVAVNLSTATLLRPDLVELVTGALARSGAEPARLVLEITEHEAVPDEPGVQYALRVLADLGVGIWLDDFGVGYTCLHYVERFPITTIKVDKSLSATALRPEPSPLLRGLVALGASAGLTTLAEGVETEDQAQRMLALGFELGQGYHYARPMPAAELESWAAGRRLGRRPAAGDQAAWSRVG